MNRRKIYVLIIGILFSFSCIQCAYIPTYSNKEIAKNEDGLLNMASEDLPTVEWKRNWQGPNNDEGLALTLDSSENIYITGSSGDYYSNLADFLYLRYSKSGALLNSLTWDRNTENNVGRDILIDSSNFVYTAGYTDVDSTSSTNYNTYLRKATIAGAQQWEHIWGGSDYDVARTTILDASENVYIGGLTWSYGGGEADMLLIKYSNAGALQWNQTYGGIDSEWANSIAVDSSGNIYLGGGFRYLGGSYYDSNLIKVDSNGIFQWERHWGGASDDLGNTIAIDSHDNIYMVGSTTSYGAVNSDMLLLKYNSDGDLLWNITWGTDNMESGWPIVIDEYDGIYVGGDLWDYGTSEDYIFLVKYDIYGNQLWNMTYDCSTNSEGLYDIALGDSGDIYLTGYEYFSGTTYEDVFLLKYNYELPDIFIFSPENKTYTEPMNGYYPATEGFESDKIGDIPKGWQQFIINGGANISVISEFENHKKVMRGFCPATGGPSASSWSLSKDFNNTEGTIEFWVALTTNSSNSQGFRLNIANGSYTFFELELRQGEIGLWIGYNGGAHFNRIGNYEINTWNHIRLDYRSNTGNPYGNLNPNEFKIYINGVDKGTYIFKPADPIAMYMYSWGFYEDFFTYIDAIGYSWDPNYNVGDNLNEGLLLDYKSKHLLDWQAYSLDGQQNIIISNTTVILFPDDGKHTIQLFGNNSIGDLFQSEKKYFSVDTRIPEIIIHSPINDEIFQGVPPLYDISIIEENLVSAWYTLDGGNTNFTLTELSDYIDLERWLALPNGPVTIEFFGRDIAGNIASNSINVVKEIVNPILVDLVDLMCTTESFNFTFEIYNEHGIGIDSATMQIWWNGADVSGEVQNLGGGLYFLSLEPILVSPGEEPILLNMTVSASGYDDSYFETTVSIDPDTVQKLDDDVESPVTIIIIISTVSAGIVIGIITYIYLRKRKTAHSN